MTIDDYFIFASIAQHSSLRMLMQIFCGEPVIPLSEHDMITTVPRRQDWQPVMTQAADLLQVFILDKPIELQIRLILNADYGKQYFEPANIRDADGNLVSSSPILQDVADVLNLALLK